MDLLLWRQGSSTRHLIVHQPMEEFTWVRFRKKIALLIFFSWPNNRRRRSHKSRDSGAIRSLQAKSTRHPCLRTRRRSDLGLYFQPRTRARQSGEIWILGFEKSAQMDQFFQAEEGILLDQWYWNDCRRWFFLRQWPGTNFFFWILKTINLLF